MTERPEQTDDQDQPEPQAEREPAKKHGDPLLNIEGEAAAGGGPEIAASEQDDRPGG
jgi:hypothetical protein